MTLGLDNKVIPEELKTPWSTVQRACYMYLGRIEWSLKHWVEVKHTLCVDLITYLHVIIFT
jgi:hypothetical protein